MIGQRDFVYAPPPVGPAGYPRAMASPARVAVLLRGVNVGRAKRIAMSDFAALLRDLGVTDVRTLLNSGNAVGTTSLTAARLAAAVEEALEERVGFTCDVVARTKEEIAAALAHDPLGEVATDPVATSWCSSGRRLRSRRSTGFAPSSSSPSSGR